MKALLLNALLGLLFGRFGSVWLLPTILPICVVELAYGVYAYHLSLGGGLRRGAALFVCGQIAFLLGTLLRPLPGEA